MKEYTRYKRKFREELKRGPAVCVKCGFWKERQVGADDALLQRNLKCAKLMLRPTVCVSQTTCCVYSRLMIVFTEIVAVCFESYKTQMK